MKIFFFWLFFFFQKVAKLSISQSLEYCLSEAGNILLTHIHLQKQNWHKLHKILRKTNQILQINLQKYFYRKDNEHQKLLTDSQNTVDNLIVMLKYVLKMKNNFTNPFFF